MDERLPKYFSGELGQSDISDLLNELRTNELLREEFVRMQNVFALSHLSKLSKMNRKAREVFKYSYRK